MIIGEPQATPAEPLPSADAFVIQDSEFANIKAFFSRRAKATAGIGNKGYPTGSILNDDIKGGSWDIGYTSTDTLRLTIPGERGTGYFVFLDLRPPEITKIREWIVKYREWKQKSKTEGLEPGIAKPLSSIGYAKFAFVTPDILKIDHIELREDDVNGLWRRLTTNLPLMRTFALQRITKAERQIAEEDQRRAAQKAELAKQRAAVDAALR